MHWQDLKQRLQQSSLATMADPSRTAQRKQEVYRQRAIRFASRDASARVDAAHVPTLVFALGDQHFGIPLRQVAQVYPTRSLTPVPRVPSWVLGIASFDNQIRSVIGLAELLETPCQANPSGGHVLLVRGAESAVAVQVDHVDEIQSIDFGQLSAVDESARAARARFARGVTPQHVVILCADALVAQTTAPLGHRF